MLPSFLLSSFVVSTVLSSSSITLPFYKVSSDYGSLYFVRALIGSNRILTKLLVDTGSSDIWVPNSREAIQNDNVNDDNSAKLWFDPTTSKSFKNLSTEFSALYADGSTAEGYYGEDNIVIEGSEYQHVQFASVNKTTSSMGIFGIGPQSNEVASEPYDNFPLYLYNNKFVKNAQMAISFESNNDIVGRMGSIIFGSVDIGDYCRSNLYYHNLGIVSGKVMGYATLLNTIAYGKNSVNLQDAYVFFDTGYSYMSVPHQVYGVLGNLFNVTYLESIQRYVAPCDITGIFSLSFGQQNLTFELTDFLSEQSTLVNGQQQCLLDMLNSTADYFVFGQNFIEKTFITFDLDNAKVGLCVSKSSDSDPINSGASDSGNTSDKFNLRKRRPVEVLTPTTTNTTPSQPSYGDNHNLPTFSAHSLSVSFSGDKDWSHAASSVLNSKQYDGHGYVPPKIFGQRRH